MFGKGRRILSPLLKAMAKLIGTSEPLCGKLGLDEVVLLGQNEPSCKMWF